MHSNGSGTGSQESSCGPCRSSLDWHQHASQPAGCCHTLQGASCLNSTVRFTTTQCSAALYNTTHQLNGTASFRGLEQLISQQRSFLRCGASAPACPLIRAASPMENRCPAWMGYLAPVHRTIQNCSLSLQGVCSNSLQRDCPSMPSRLLCLRVCIRRPAEDNNKRGSWSPKRSPPLCSCVM